jgi:hypothetical protein|tara:strand:- start:1572 stop:1784 length:213 start_codon:yes stop_codon:yes gene_type:complete
MDEELHCYFSEDGKRTASVHHNGETYIVKMFTKKDLTITDEWVKDEVRYLPNKSERYAEDCAENWVLGVF